MKNYWFYRFFKRTVSAVFLLLLIVFLFIAPIDRTPLQEQAFYRRMMRRLDTLRIPTYLPAEPLSAGWSRFSIVPDHPVRMVGYGIRKTFDSVTDTLYAKVLAINNGRITACFVTVDLLLFPPVIKELVLQKLGPYWPGFVFFGATHTHSGVGGWAPSIGGQLLMGRYDEDWVEHVAQGIVDHIRRASSHLKRARLYTWQADAKPYTYHRVLHTFDRVDGLIRGVSLVREDSSKALLFAYSAHPTLLSGSTNRSLSNDYLSLVFKQLSKSYAFVQFMGGMMAGHTIARVVKPDYATHLASAFDSLIVSANTTLLSDSLSVRAVRIPVEHGKAQLRIAANWKLRHWVFRRLFMGGPLRGEITFLSIGNILFLGTSCDFSGELSYRHRYDSLAMEYGKKMIITGFNGEYTGYVTPDYLYHESDHEEVRYLSWVGPHFGEYYNEMIEKILARSASSNPQ